MFQEEQQQQQNQSSSSQDNQTSDSPDQNVSDEQEQRASQEMSETQRLQQSAANTQAWMDEWEKRIALAERDTQGSSSDSAEEQAQLLSSRQISEYFPIWDNPILHSDPFTMSRVDMAYIVDHLVVSERLTGAEGSTLRAFDPQIDKTKAIYREINVPE